MDLIQFGLNAINSFAIFAPLILNTKNDFRVHVF